MANYVLPPRFVFQRISEGNGFIVPHLTTSPSNGSTNVHIKNPHTDKVMWLADMVLQVEGNQTFHIHDDFNSITDGTPIQLQNALMDSQNGGIDAGPFEAYEDSTFDSKTSYPLGFTSDDKRNVTLSRITATAIEPDREAVIEVQNNDSVEHNVYFSALILTSY